MIKVIKMSKKSRTLIIGIVSGLFFLILWIKMINWNEFIAYFQDPKIWKVIPFSFFYILAYILRSLRWREIMKPIYKMSRIESFGVFSTGLLVNYLIPVRAGELVKSFVLKIKKQIPVASSLPTIFLDKLTDLFPIILVIVAIPLISMQFNSKLLTIIVLIMVVFVLLLFFCYIAIYHRDFAYKITVGIFRIFPRKIQTKLNEFLGNFLSGISIVKSKEVKLFKVFLLTFLAVLSEAIYIYLLFSIFGSKLTFLQVMLGYTLMNLTYILPTPPAQIGSNQFMWVLIFSFGLGADKNLTSAAVTLSHLLTSVIIYMMGSTSMLLLNVKYSELMSGKRISIKEV